jgi:hypothetical protein
MGDDHVVEDKGTLPPHQKMKRKREQRHRKVPPKHVKQAKKSEKWFKPSGFARVQSFESFETILHPLIGDVALRAVQEFMYDCGLEKSRCSQRTRDDSTHFLCHDCSAPMCKVSMCSTNCSRLVHQSCSSDLRKCENCRQGYQTCVIHTRTWDCKGSTCETSCCILCLETCSQCDGTICSKHRKSYEQDSICSPCLGSYDQEDSSDTQDSSESE